MMIVKRVGVPGIILTGCVVAIFASTTPAVAGFEWTAPPSPPPTLSPSTEITGFVAAPEMPALPLASVETSVVPVAVPAIANPVSEQGFAEALGFGSDLPLVLAMRQFVPPHYAFSFDPAVDQGARVSWNGGRPWNVVLDDALKPLGLAAQVAEGTVRIAPMPVIVATPVMVEEMTPPEPQLESRMSAPLMLSPAEPNVALKSDTGVHEVYIRRNGETTAPSDDKASSIVEMNEALSPAAGLPGLEEEAKVSQAPVLMQGPILTASGGENKDVGMQPVSFAGEKQVRSSGTAMIETARHQGVMDPYDVRFWQAEKGDSLKNVLSTWSDSAGVELYWVSAEDYVLPEAIRLHGNYTEALSSLLSSYGDLAKRPQGRLHPNLPTGPSVLIIEPAQN